MSELLSPTLKQVFLSVLIAGLVGEIAFEMYAWFISPVLFGVTLQPANLVITIIAKLTGVQVSHAVAFPIHFIIGSFGFGVFVYLIRLLMPTRVWLTGFVSGLVLWFAAQGILAPFIGRSFMMDFSTYTQSSFIGHVGMTLLMARVLEAALSRFTRKLGSNSSGEVIQSKC